jgi:hypothetical protein
MSTPMPPPMSRDEVDWAIVSLVAAYDRISAAMYALDTHPGLAALRAGGLRGQTDRLAGEVLARTAVLWSRFIALGDLLGRARAVRAERSRPGAEELRELTALLRGPVVGIAADGLVLDDAAAGPPAARLTLADLARQLEADSAQVIDAVAGVDRNCTQLAGLLAQPADALGRLRVAAAALGEDALPDQDLDRLEARLGELHAEAFGDPVAAAGSGPVATRLHDEVRQLGAQIDALHGRLAELSDLRAGYPERVRQLRRALAELATAEAEAGRSYAVALEKIDNPGLPPLPRAADGLRSQVAQLDQLHREGRWAGLASELGAAERGVTVARERAEHLRAAADGLLHRRSELRGRLDAYRAKAARLGLIEHSELSARHRTARELLYTSPCDLPTATRAVAAYQTCLNGLTERTVKPVEGSRRDD